MPLHIEITFRKSRSKDYPYVLKHARKFIFFNETERKLTITDVEELFSNWENFTVVVHYTKKWAGTIFSYNGKPITPFKSDIFYALQNVKDCHKQYNKAFDKEGYCDEADWGCHRLDSVSRFLDRGGYYNYWYEYGHFDTEDTWKIDKQRIRQTLLEEARLKCLSVCPAFNANKISELLTQLPNELYIDGVKWKKVYKLDYLANGPVRIPVEIEHNFDSATDPEYIESKDLYYDEPEEETPLIVPSEITNELADELIEEWKRKNGR